MQNLELSSRDIAKQLEWTEWEVSNDTVCDIINNLPQLTTASIEWTLQIARLDSIIWGIEDITSKMIVRIANKEDITINEVKQLNEIAKTNWERRQLLAGKPTENKTINIIKWMSDAELLEML